MVLSTSHPASLPFPHSLWAHHQPPAVPPTCQLLLTSLPSHWWSTWNFFSQPFHLAKSLTGWVQGSSLKSPQSRTFPWLLRKQPSSNQAFTLIFPVFTFLLCPYCHLILYYVFILYHFFIIPLSHWNVSSRREGALSSKTEPDTSQYLFEKWNNPAWEDNKP